MRQVVAVLSEIVLSAFQEVTVMLDSRFRTMWDGLAPESISCLAPTRKNQFTVIRESRIPCYRRARSIERMQDQDQRSWHRYVRAVEGS